MLVSSDSLSFNLKASQRYGVEFRQWCVTATGEHAWNFRTYYYSSDVRATHVCGRFEEYITTLYVRKQQTVGIAGHARAFHIFLLHHFGIERHIKRQRTVQNNIAELTAIGHFGKDGAVGRRYYRREQLLRRCYGSNLGTVNSERTGDCSKITDDFHLLLEIRQRDYGYVSHTEKTLLLYPVEDRHVAEQAACRKEVRSLIEDSAHILVSRHETLHQYVGMPGSGRIDSHRHTLNIYEFIYKAWPVIFILLGIEILLANGRKNVEFVYDKTAIGLVAFLIIFSMFMAVIGFAVETSTRYYEQEYQRWIYNTYDEKAGNVE